MKVIKKKVDRSLPTIFKCPLCARDKAVKYSLYVVLLRDSRCCTLFADLT